MSNVRTDVSKKYVIEIMQRYNGFFLLTVHWFAWLFTILAVTGCNFMETQGDNIGIFSRPYFTLDGESLGCIKYTAMDGMLKAARGFGIMASILSSATVLLVTYSIAWRLHKLAWKICFYLVLGTTFCQVMTYLALGSRRCISGCSLTGTGSLAVFNTILLIGLSIATLKVIPSGQPWMQWYEVEESSRMLTTESACKNNLEDDRSDVSSTTSSRRENRENRPFFSIQKLTGFRIITVGAISITWIVSIVGLRRCTFLQTGPKNGTIVTRMGLFSQAIESQGEFFGCVAYPESVKEEFDGPFKTARAFGTIAVFLLTILVVVMIIQLFVKRVVELSWYTVRAVMTAATSSELIVFCIFDTKICNVDEHSECHLGGIGIVTVLNVLFMVTITVMSFAIPPASVPIFQINRLMGVQPRNTKKGNQFQKQDEMKRNHERILRHQSPLRDQEETSDSHDSNSWKDVIKSSQDRPIKAQEKLTSCDEESQDDYDNVESITFQVEYNNNQKITTKTVLHSDGIRNVTTSIETLTVEDHDLYDERFSDDASSLGKDM
jgi:hypothetical protein